VISSTIIQDIDQDRAVGLAKLAFYYFDSRESKKQDLYGVLSSLLWQLSAESDSYLDILSKLYSDSVSGTRKPTSSAAYRCLIDMLKFPGQGRIYIVIDALDECSARNVSGRSSAREEVLKLIKEVVGFEIPNVHLCVASRPEIDVMKFLRPLNPLEISLHDEVAQKDDVVKYIKSAVNSYSETKGWDDEQTQLIIETLSQDANGM